MSRTPLSLDGGRHLVERYVERYNNVRLNSAIGYITPKGKLAGRQQEIHVERDQKLEARRGSRDSSQANVLSATLSASASRA